jgi:uncharacterized protein
VARGEAGPDSDIDLVVVLDDDVPLEMLGGKAVAESRASYPCAVDLIPCRASVLRTRYCATVLPSMSAREAQESYAWREAL